VAFSGLCVVRTPSHRHTGCVGAISGRVLGYRANRAYQLKPALWGVVGNDSGALWGAHTATRLGEDSIGPQNGIDG
jgi:hypothetical protein